jgi:predicted signal transduction protein with EAL and GGDEF domain
MITALDLPWHLHPFDLRTRQKLLERAGFTLQDAPKTIRGAAWIFPASRAVEWHGRFCMAEVTRWS